VIPRRTPTTGDGGESIRRRRAGRANGGARTGADPGEGGAAAAARGKPRRDRERTPQAAGARATSARRANERSEQRRWPHTSARCGSNPDLRGPTDKCARRCARWPGSTAGLHGGGGGGGRGGSTCWVGPHRRFPERAPPRRCWSGAVHDGPSRGARAGAHVDRGTTARRQRRLGQAFKRLDCSREGDCRRRGRERWGETWRAARRPWAGGRRASESRRRWSRTQQVRRASRWPQGQRLSSEGRERPRSANLRGCRGKCGSRSCQTTALVERGARMAADPASWRARAGARVRPFGQ